METPSCLIDSLIQKVRLPDIFFLELQPETGEERSGTQRLSFSIELGRSGGAGGRQPYSAADAETHGAAAATAAAAAAPPPPPCAHPSTSRSLVHLILRPPALPG